jgi:voltage-gated potassium channel
MSTPLEVSRVGAIVLRQMRRPIFTLLWVYAIAVAGMTLIPGKEINGQTHYMSIFHAFYFLTYTATTTGFGEIPYEFSNAQRLWAILCLYVSVVAWFYAIGAIIQLVQNPYFQRALAEQRFARQAQRITDPFYILCGFGDTGSLVARGLSDAGIPGVIIESEVERIKALSLRDYRVPMPGLCADAGIPKHLIEAGVQRTNCLGIIIVTSDEEVNLRVSVIAHLLNPTIKIITMSKVDIYEERLASLGREVHIVDPFKTFSRGLGVAMFHPELYTLNRWLIGAPGATLKGAVNPPTGTWIICGYGRMGHELHTVLSESNVRTAIIDIHPRPEDVEFDCYIEGRATERNLIAAGIDQAAGILIATDDDGRNLGILVNARALNPDLYIIVRQNRHENEVAFDAGHADIIMQPSLVTARRIVFSLIAPLLKPLFQHLMEVDTRDHRIVTDLIARLDEVIGTENPQLVTIRIDDKTGSAVMALVERGEKILLGDILRDPGTRNLKLATVPLVVRSATGIRIMPPDDYHVQENDEILFCGREYAHRLLKSNLYNEYALHYVLKGYDEPRSWVMQWAVRKFARGQEEKLENP